MKVFVMGRIGQVGITDQERPECGPLDAILRPTRRLICTPMCTPCTEPSGEREDLTLGHEVVGAV